MKNLIKTNNLVKAAAITAILFIQGTAAFAMPDTTEPTEFTAPDPVIMGILASLNEKPAPEQLYTSQEHVYTAPDPAIMLLLDRLNEKPAPEQLASAQENDATQESEYYVQTKIEYVTSKKLLYVKSSSNHNRFSTVRIIDNRGKIVHEENLEHSEFLTRRYDVSKLPKGRYEVTVVSGGVSSREVINL